MTSRRTKISPKTRRGLGHVTILFLAVRSAILATAWLLVYQRSMLFLLNTVTQRHSLYSNLCVYWFICIMCVNVIKGFTYLFTHSHLDCISALCWRCKVYIKGRNLLRGFWYLLDTLLDRILVCLCSVMVMQRSRQLRLNYGWVNRVVPGLWTNTSVGVAQHGRCRVSIAEFETNIWTVLTHRILTTANAPSYIGGNSSAVWRTYMVGQLK